MTRIRFTAPAQTKPRVGVDTDNRDALEAALLTLPGASITLTAPRSVLFVPDLTTPDICTPTLLFKVPLRPTKLGLRARQSALRYRAYVDGMAHATDRDILRLKCTP